MLSKYIPYKKIYLLALLMLAVGLSTGKFLMSLSSIILASAWVLEGNYKEKWERIRSYAYAPIVLAFGYLIHVAWLINTKNLEYGFHDLVLKLPLLSFPIVIGSIPKLSRRNYLLIIGAFILGLLVSTLISFGVYLEIFPTKRDISDIRNISIFISHIRLSLLICIAIILSVYYFFASFKFSKLVVPAICIWFVYFLYLLSGTGIVLLFGLCIYSIVWIVIKIPSMKKKMVIGVLGLLLAAGIIGFVYSSYQDYATIKDKSVFSQLDLKTENGDLYIHDTLSLVTENGYYLWLYVAPLEVEKAWEKRSSIAFDSTDRKGQLISGTIYRYITSKGLRKDKVGVEQLTDEEIQEIENGRTSSVNLSGLEKRLHQVFFEFENREEGFSANGHSVTQRLNFSTTGLLIAQDNLFFGVGTGDVPDSFERKYIEIESDLEKENRKRAHNQFLTFIIAFGLVGFILWLLTFIYPILKIHKEVFIYGAFLLIALLSFISEDTLETQAGVTFFAFFNSFLLFHSKENSTT